MTLQENWRTSFPGAEGGHEGVPQPDLPEIRRLFERAAEAIEAGDLQTAEGPRGPFDFLSVRTDLEDQTAGVAILDRIVAAEARPD